MSIRSHVLQGTLCIAAALAVSASAPVAADAPTLLPIQGFLTDGDGRRVDSPITFRFDIVDSQAGGEPLFSEVHTEVPVVAGDFVVYLGEYSGGIDLSLFRDHGDLWVEVRVENDDVMQPRFRLGSVPFAAYAQYSGDAESLQGSGADAFAPTDHGHEWEQLTGVPDDIADGDQDTTYDGTDFVTSGQTCAPNEVVVAVGDDGTIQCVPDQKGEVSGADFALSGQSCAPGLVVAGVDAAGAVTCIPDADTSYGGADFALSGQACPPGQSVSGVNSLGQVTCVNSSYSGANFALSAQSCPPGQVVSQVDATGRVVCVPNTTYSGADFALSDQLCPAGSFMRGVNAAGAPICEVDRNTTYNGNNFARSGQNCPAGSVMTGINGSGSVTCTSFANAAKSFFEQRCYIYYGWRDSCDGCGNAPSKVGRVNPAGCTAYSGSDNSCITPTISGTQVRMIGINTDGDVNGDDKFYVGFKCF